MRQIKLFSPYFDNNEINSTVKTLQSHNWASGAGTGKVLEFEEKFKEYTKSKECIAVDSGTAALHLALNVIDINKKEVLVPSLTFVSTINAIKYNGGIPVFVDVDPKTMCIDTKDVKQKISKKSKVILPVHFGGMPSDMNTIIKIARRENLSIVEDAAHACGSKYFGKKIGSIGEFTCFSFHPVKNLSMPKGGAININSKDRKISKKKLQSLRWCGISNRKGPFYDITELGFNYYMDEISATIGIEQLKKIDKSNLLRLKIAKRYEKELQVLQKMPLNKECSYHLYWILVKNRKKFMRNMKSKGIETGVHYIPVHQTSMYRSNIKIPNTEQIGKEIVTLPLHPNLSNRDIGYIIKITNSLID